MVSVAFAMFATVAFSIIPGGSTSGRRAFPPAAAATGSTASRLASPPAATATAETNARVWNRGSQRINYEFAPGAVGGAAPVLLLPGFGAGAFHYRRNLREIAAATGSAVFAMDYLGQVCASCALQWCRIRARNDTESSPHHLPTARGPPSCARSLARLETEPYSNLQKSSLHLLQRRIQRQRWVGYD